MRLYRCLFKRILDILLSMLGIVLMSPFFLFITLLLAYINKGKVLFYQNRPGKNGKIFRVFKFKTMTDEKDANGNLFPDEIRLTKVGKYIRTTSLDELPQLINVLNGDMSFVGPRPLMPKYLSLYTKEQMRRHEVPPGITGWAQVNGRNNISWKAKFDLDIWYVDHLSLWLDTKIMFLTLKKVLNKEDVSKKGFATTEAFNGNN